MELNVDFSAKISVFAPDRIARTFPAGMSIKQMVEASDFRPPEWAKPICTVNDRVVECDEWHEIFPEKGDLVQVALVPMNDRDTGRIALQVVVIAAAVVATAYAGPAAGAAVAGAGNLGIALLLKPPKPKSLDQADGTTVTGQSNQILKDGVIPRVYGRVRMTPPHGALPFTEVVGDDLYLRMLLCPGHGPLNISDIRIGDTPVTAFGNDVEIEIREGRPTDAPLTLFSNDFFEENPGVKLTNSGGPTIRTTRPDTDEITVDITFPDGVFQTTKKGRNKNIAVQHIVEYAPTGTSAFVPFPNGNPFTYLAKRGGTIRKTLRVKLPVRGQYDVRIERKTGDSTINDRESTGSVWTALRSITYQDPLPYPNLAKVALRVKRDGRVDRVNMLCESYLDDYTPGIGWVERVTANPASIARDIMLGSANLNPLSAGRLREAQDLEPWHDYCDVEGFKFNGVFDSEGTVFDRLNQVAAAGRAAFRVPDGRYGFVIDQLQTTPVAMFTPRNSRNFRGNRDHVKPLHAIRVSFRNEATFQEDELIVYDDGRDELNSDPGRIEVLDFRTSGITDPNLAWRHGRFFLAQSVLRQERWMLDIGLQSLVVNRGDLVRIQNDVLLGGAGIISGRVKSVTSDGGGNTTTITVDEVLTMEAGKSYGIDAQVVDGSGQPQIVTALINLDVGNQTTVTFTTPVPATQAIRAGDIVSFGEAGVETIDCIVTGVSPNKDHGATISLINAAPDIHNADTGTIPPFDSKITLPGDFFGIPPAVPVIDRIYLQKVNTPVQPDTVHGETIVIVLDRASDNRQPPENYQVRLRIKGDIEFSQRYVFPGDSAQLSLPPVQVDQIYELQVRALGRSPAGVPNESSFSSLFEVNVPQPDSTTADIPQIAGLELFNQGNDTSYSGRDPQFVWRLTSGLGSFTFENDGVEAFSDPALAFYEIRVLNVDGSIERRTDLIRVPQYTYRYEDNLEDTKRLTRERGLPEIPARSFIFSVKVLDTFGREGAEKQLLVTNPAPNEPAGLSVEAGIGQVFVSATAPTDPDFAGIKVWASTTQGFVPNDDTNLAARALQNHVTFTAVPGDTLYVRVAFFDVFSESADDLNISSEFAIDITSATAIPDFAFDGILFTPNSPTPDQVSWTSGTATTLIDGTATSETVAAGTATYPGSGPLILYYAGGTGQIFATTDLTQAAATNARVLAIYRGGTDLKSGNGDVLVDGSLITAGSIGTQQLAAGSVNADILSTTELITESAQIGNLVVETSNIADLAVTTIEPSFEQFTKPPSGAQSDRNYNNVSQSSITSTGLPVIILGSFLIVWEDLLVRSFDWIFDFRVIRNGTIILQVNNFEEIDGSVTNTLRRFKSFNFIDQAGAGLFTYTTQLQFRPPGSGSVSFSGFGMATEQRHFTLLSPKK